MNKKIINPDHLPINKYQLERYLTSTNEFRIIIEYERIENITIKYNKYILLKA